MKTSTEVWQVYKLVLHMKEEIEVVKGKAAYSFNHPYLTDKEKSQRLYGHVLECYRVMEKQLAELSKEQYELGLKEMDEMIKENIV